VGFSRILELTKESGQNASGNQANDGHDGRTEMGADQHRSLRRRRATLTISANPAGGAISAGLVGSTRTLIVYHR